MRAGAANKEKDQSRAGGPAQSATLIENRVGPLALKPWWWRHRSRGLTAQAISFRPSGPPYRLIGTHRSNPQMPFFIRNLVLLQQRFEFRRELPRAMMFFLIANVICDLRLR